MPTTTRLGMNKPQSADVIDVTTAISNQMGTLDRAVIVEACTSSTRPSTGLFTGKLILETDTKNLMRYTGSTWEIINNSNYPRGYCGFKLNTTASSASSNGVEVAVSGLTVTFNAYVGRRYAVWATFPLESLSGQDVACVTRFRYAFGTSVTTAGTLVGNCGTDLNEQGVDANPQQACFKTFTVSATGQITVGMFLINSQTTGTETVRVAAGHQSLFVEDIGSN